MNKIEQNGKSLESWIWDAACSIRGAKDAPKYKEFILPLIFTKEKEKGSGLDLSVMTCCCKVDD